MMTLYLSEKGYLNKEQNQTRKLMREKNKISPWAVALAILTVASVCLAIVALFLRDTTWEERKLEYTGIHEEKRKELKTLEQIEQEKAEKEAMEAYMAIPRDEWYMLLVNRDHPVPEDLQIDTEEYRGVSFNKLWVEDFKKMDQAAKAAGIELVPYSAYRTYDAQTEYYNSLVEYLVSIGYSREIAESPLSNREDPPEYSELCAGLGVDILCEGHTVKDLNFANTSAYKWLCKNAYKYGFILRYPEGKEDFTGVMFRPYKWRYVGVEQATLIHDSGKCLEEYLS